MESSVDMNTFISLFVVVTVLVLLVTGFVLLITGVLGRTGQVVGAVLGSGFLLMLVVGTVLFSLTAVRMEQRFEIEHAEAEMESARMRHITEVSTAVEDHASIQHSSSDSPTEVQTDHAKTPQAAVTATAESAESPARINAGHELGRLAGSVYQEVRNQIRRVDATEITSSIIPPGRPAWVEQDPIYMDDGTYRVAVSSGPYDRVQDARSALDVEVRRAIDTFANELLQDEKAASLLSTHVDRIEGELIKETYQEELTPSFGIMHQRHAFIEIDVVKQKQLRQDWMKVRHLFRLGWAGIGFAAVLAVLIALYGGLSWTSRPDHGSPWLASGAIVAAVGMVVFAMVMVSRYLPMV